MTRNFLIPFAKFHGLGNDFIVTLGRRLPRSWPRLARSLCNRNTGVGADGLIVVLAAQNKKHDARVRFFNADGSEAEMSGNGIRCAAAYLAAKTRPRRRWEIETGVGVKSLKLVKMEKGRWTFHVGMGAPTLTPAKIPFRAGDFLPPVVGFPLRTQRGLLPVTITSVGNPHCTLFVGDFAAIDWKMLGREIELNKRFPRRTNVEFVKVISQHEIEVRFWERGVGETMSSGTGSCGAVVACILNGLTARKVRVRTPAGNLEVDWPKNGGITLTGPVERIADGTYYYGG